MGMLPSPQSDKGPEAFGKKVPELKNVRGFGQDAFQFH